MDGVGEWTTTSVAIGKGNNLTTVREIRWPHSIGLLYSAFTYYIGFKVNSGEYKLMGLAPYGDPAAAGDTFLVEDSSGLLHFGAGWKNRFNIEDTICAGAIAERLMESRLYSTDNDSTLAAIDLWSLAKKDLPGYIEKVAQRTRLREKGLDDCIGFCITPDFTEKIPVIKNGVLVDITL
jgi:predicted NodU family carbamoyl transferase